MGRPTEFNNEIGSKILNRISDGESVRKICEDADMPAKSTIFKWLLDNKGFSDQYTKAKQEQAELLADEIVEISDTGKNDWMKKNHPDNEGYVINGEAIARSRLRVDARKWVAARLLPKKYGDKIENVISNKDGETFKTSSMTDKELNARLAEFTALNKKK